MIYRARNESKKENRGSAFLRGKIKKGYNNNNKAHNTHKDQGHLNISFYTENSKLKKKKLKNPLKFLSDSFLFCSKFIL